MEAAGTYRAKPQVVMVSPQNSLDRRDRKEMLGLPDQLAPDAQIVWLKPPSTGRMSRKVCGVAASGDCSGDPS